MAFAPGQPSVLQHRTNDIAGEPAARLSSLGLLWVFPPTSERRGASHPTPPRSRLRAGHAHARTPACRASRSTGGESGYQIRAPICATRRASKFYLEPTRTNRAAVRRAQQRAAVGPRRSTVEGWGTYIAIAVDSGYNRGARRRDARPTCADTRACGGHARELTRQRPAHARSLLLAPPSGKPLGGSVRRGAVCSSGTL